MMVREATVTDLKGILNLYAQLNPTESVMEFEAAKAIWTNQIDAQGIKYFVTVEDEIIVSSCYLAILPNLTRQGRCIGFIENLITDRAHRRRGIARQLLNTALDSAKAHGCYKVVLQSGNSRTDAHLLYENTGFDGTSKRAFEFRF